MRDSVDSRYIGLCMPRVLARVPYGAKTEPVEEFALGEAVAAPQFEEDRELAGREARAVRPRMEGARGCLRQKIGEVGCRLLAIKVHAGKLCRFAAEDNLGSPRSGWPRRRLVYPCEGPEMREAAGDRRRVAAASANYGQRPGEGDEAAAVSG